MCPQFRHTASHDIRVADDIACGKSTARISMSSTIHSQQQPSGALPAGTRVEKINSGRGDSHSNGALGKGALSVGIDSIGLIPEAGGIARIIGHQAGYAGVVADQAGSRLIGAVNATANTASGLAGLTDTSPTGLASTGLTIAGFIPGLNDAAAVGSIGLDLFKTAKAVGACY